MRLASLVILAWAAAAKPAPAPAAPSGSLEALVSAAVSRLSARDAAGLDGLAAGREDFLRAYPGFEQDTSRARRDFACAYFLADNRKLLERHIENVPGKLELSRFAVDGPVEDMGTMILYRNVRIWVRSAQGESELGFIRSVAGLPGGYKIWSFRDR